jgi:hypothetical protein
MTNVTTAAIRRTLLIAPALAMLLAIASPGMLAGQTVFYACYVPASGTVYRIKEPGLPQQCGQSKKQGTTVQHVEFNWSPGVNDHSSLAGLGNDDHPQYVLAEGLRTSVNGFALNAPIFASGSIPASGPGSRLMWYPGKSAFRAGRTANHWDDANIGLSSAVLGQSSTASGDYSVALGLNATASGDWSIALSGGTASGSASIASGTDSHASGSFSIALGFGAVASGAHSVALGTYSNTNNRTGAFVYADRSTLSPVSALADNQFVVRASRFWLGSNNSVTAIAGRFLETSTGAFLSSGGTWTNSSDVNRKRAFEDVDRDEVLARVAALPIRTWSYRDEDASVRHIGPTAQDFHAAFSLGTSETSIATVDADGISLAAIQALVKRTTELNLENESLRRANDELRDEVRAIAQRLDAFMTRPTSGDRR